MIEDGWIDEVVRHLTVEDADDLGGGALFKLQGSLLGKEGRVRRDDNVVVLDDPMVERRVDVDQNVEAGSPRSSPS